MGIDDLLNVSDGEAIKEHGEQSGHDAFVLSRRPLVPVKLQEQSPVALSDYEYLGDLPRTYGRPVLFGIARDPHTLFTYWEIDWKTTFGDKPPADRKVCLRVISKDGIEQCKVSVEPFAGNHSVTVLQAQSVYRIELGYHEPADVWNSVAMSDAIATPPNDVSESADIDVATVPFHMSFQRMVDSFCASKYDGEALVQIVGRLQERVDNPGENDLTNSDLQLLRAIDCASSGTDATERACLRKSKETFAMRQRIESILGFGASSSTNSISAR